MDEAFSNEARHELLPKKSKITLYSRSFIIKAVLPVVYTNKMESFSFKSGHAVWVAELTKEDTPIVL